MYKRLWACLALYRGNFFLLFLKFYSRNLHNIARSDRIGFMTKNYLDFNLNKINYNEQHFQSAEFCECNCSFQTRLNVQCSHFLS